MNTDAELLRRYVEDRSEVAFTELVRLHLNLVYFAALRQVGGDTHRAKDVAQTVFTDLARKAHLLTARPTLTGWLHTSTRFAAAKLRRADSTRQQLEQEATTMNALLSDPDPAAEWERLGPLIDDTIHELDERDQEAVLLRYFENRPFAEIGATLRLSEDAARMRVDRALEKLRAALARSGVNSASAALATVLANQVTASAPAGLANSISGTALAGIGAGGLAVAGTGIFMSIKTTAIISAVALAAIVATFLQWNRAFRAESELATVTVDRDGLRAEVRTGEQRASRATQDLAALRGELDTLKAKQLALQTAPRAAAPVPAAQTTPVPKPTLEQVRRLSMDKAIQFNLRQISGVRVEFQRRNGRPPASLEEVVGEGKLLRALVPVNGESYASLSLVPGAPLAVTDSDGVSVTFDPSAPQPPAREPTPAEKRANELGSKISGAVKTAMAAYRAANGGALPATPQALIPFFATVQEGADFVEALEAQAAASGK